jgi:hypothetical protein
MKRQIRWSSSDSEAEPVLRAVMRYAQNEAPRPDQVEALRQRILARSERTRPRRKPLASVALFATIAFSGGAIAFAGWALVAGRFEHSDGDVAQLVREPLSRSGAARRDPVPPAQPPPAQPTAEKQQPPPPSPRPAVALGATVSPGATTPRSEIDLLQQARRVLSTAPAQALTLTQQHAVKYPRSEFSEEREALQIEALMRLGRRSEADARLSDFTQRYPRSVYLRRMLR